MNINCSDNDARHNHAKRILTTNVYLMTGGIGLFYIVLFLFARNIYRARKAYYAKQV